MPNHPIQPQFAKLKKADDSNPWRKGNRVRFLRNIPKIETNKRQKKPTLTDRQIEQTARAQTASGEAKRKFKNKKTIRRE